MSVIHEWVTNVKGYNRNVRLFLWANILFQIGMGFFMIMYNLYVRALGYDPVVLGQVISMTSLATAIALIPAGLLSDRIGRKKVIVLGLLLTTVSFALRAILEAKSGLVVTAFMTGAFSAFIQVSAIPFLSENSTKEQRVHLFSFNFAILMLANVVGNVGGGVLTDMFQHVMGLSEVISLRITLLIGAAITLFAIVPLFMIQEKRKLVTKKITTFSIKTIKEGLKANKTSFKVIGIFAVSQMFIGFGAGLVIPYLNVYFADRFDASNTSIGIVVSLGQAATAIAMFIGPFVVRKLGEVRAVVFLQMSSIPFLLITGLTTNFQLASVSFLFRQALMNAGNPIHSSIMMAKVDDSMKGLANSVGQMVFMLGWALMGPVSTAIVSAYGNYWGYAYVFAITATLYFCGSSFFYYSFHPKREEKNLRKQGNSHEKSIE
ncbi:MFS transporter [Bacillus horti]|uniref:MFS family permease n=1 Tax=Caldalkalibacillus horti TaxID=77523 RepID=A0ABT9VTY5_9BACI|nr:MFS transporter [Bacillus horti]MDQ0164444.1 MFS family permease [Bacillus horti]